MIEKLDEFWSRYLDDCAPEAHMLKHKFKDRWVRFHSLPESKRYRESETENQVVLLRHNALLQEINDSLCHLIVVLPEYSEVNVPSEPEKELKELFSVTEYWRSVTRHDEGDEYESYLHLYVANLECGSEKFDQLISLVASGVVRDITFIALSSNSVFHPYDGGADLILESAKKRDDLVHKYGDWLSSHPRGY